LARVEYIEFKEKKNFNILFFLKKKRKEKKRKKLSSSHQPLDEASRKMSEILLKTFHLPNHQIEGNFVIKTQAPLHP
jgi:hypothetical protein